MKSRITIAYVMAASLVLFATTADAQRAFSIGRVKIRVSTCSDQSVPAADGTTICALHDDQGRLSQATGTSVDGVRHKLLVSYPSDPTSLRSLATYFENDQLILTISHVWPSGVQRLMAVIDPTGYAAHVEILPNRAYYYEAGADGIRYQEVIGDYDPNAVGEAKFPPGFFDAFRYFWVNRVAYAAQYFEPVLGGGYQIENSYACNALASVAAVIGCRTNAVCLSAITASLSNLCDSVDAHFPTVGFSDDGSFVIIPPAVPTQGGGGSSGGTNPPTGAPPGEGGRPKGELCTPDQCD